MMDRIGSRVPLPPVRVIESGARTGVAIDVVRAAPKVAPRSLPPSMVAAARELSTSPPVDAARVATIKNALASGNYPIRPDAIAAKMVELDVPVRG